MKYGVFTNGRTTTYYGNDATAALAWMSMLTAISQSDAEKKVLKAAGSFQLALLDSMSKQGFPVSDSLRKKVERKQADYKKAQESLARAALKKKFDGKPVKVAKRLISKKCALCAQDIAPLQGYQEAGQNKAHAACVSSPR